jgi:hypothetical protein
MNNLQQFLVLVAASTRSIKQRTSLDDHSKAIRNVKLGIVHASVGKVWHV